MMPGTIEQYAIHFARAVQCGGLREAYIKAFADREVPNKFEILDRASEILKEEER